LDSTVVATWIQAIGSAGSLLAFAAWVGIAVINRKDEQEIRFERQAQTVAAWIDKGVDYQSGDEYVVAITNGGDSPVYHCEVTLQGLVAHDEAGVVTLHLVPPHTTKAVPTPTSIVGLSWQDIYASGIAPELTFRDSSGRHWQRDGDGVLSEL
jgi:hypothetical protein